MSLFQRKIHPDNEVAKSLGLQPGDIIISEMPYDDAERTDFEKFSDFKPSHTGVWAGHNLEKPFVRASREIYTPPGLCFSNVWEGRHTVFRYIHTERASLFATIMVNWASENQSTLFAQTQHVQSGQDLIFLFQKPELNLGIEGILTALCFTALRENLGEPCYKNGQRCTTILTAAFQASLLASIVKVNAEKNHFHSLKDYVLEVFLEEIFVVGWRDTQLGKKLLAAIDKKDFSGIFPDPFSVDLHHANPRSLYDRLVTAIEFVHVGYFSFFEDELVSIEKNDGLGSAASF